MYKHLNVYITHNKHPIKDN